jgi:UDP-N-acetylmuramoyl-tripeptide--D-alanyl-D-alanine ligase
MLTAGEVLQATAGELLQGGADIRIRRIATDTRDIRKGDLFVAIKGEHFDAHCFLAQAVAGGAVALLISDRNCPVPAGVVAIAVKDTVLAYGDLARFYRKSFSRVRICAVTGSAGKTTTKEMIAAVLGTRFRVLFNKGTENNHIGVPATLLKMKSLHQAAVIEAGTNHHGEIARLAAIVEPDVAVFTNVGPSHLEGLGSPDGVFQEKAALAAYVRAGGLLVVNNDDARLFRLPGMFSSLRTVTFSVDKPSDIRATKVEISRKGLAFCVGKEAFRLKDPVPGNLYNALAAIACAREMKIPFSEIRRGLLRFRAPAGRQCFHRAGRVTVIDDAYNANPVSFRNAVCTLQMLRPARSILVAADMLELGSGAQDLHRQAGEFVTDRKIDILLTCGNLARHIAQGAVQGAGQTRVVSCSDQQEVLSFLRENVRSGDAVLVKGSRGMKMENVVKDLLLFLKG